MSLDQGFNWFKASTGSRVQMVASSASVELFKRFNWFKGSIG